MKETFFKKPYFKKIDRSFFEWGLIIPREYELDFLWSQDIALGGSRDIKIKFQKKFYRAKIYNVNRKHNSNVYQLRWDIDKDFQKILVKNFIHSYVILKSQKELHENSKSNKKFRSNLSDVEQEVLSLRPVSFDEIHAESFIKIKTEWNTLFSRLADANVFGWLFNKDNKYLISRSTGWYSYKDFSKHANEVSVIYYLANTKTKTLYIGKAEKLGSRVQPGRNHQGMKGDWDKFRYDLVKPEFSNLLERIEDHTIRSFASVLTNTKNFSSLELSEYKLVNKNWKRL